MKKTKRHYKKKSLLEAAHELAADLYEAKIIDATTMRDFDAACLPPVKQFTPYQIKALRLNQKVSQAVFAKCLNTSASTIKQWEQGDKTPRGASLKLLNLVDCLGINFLIHPQGFNF